MPWPKTRRPRSGGVYTSHATDFNSYILFRRTFCFYEFTKFSYESGERKLNGMKKNRTLRIVIKDHTNSHTSLR